MNNFWDTWKNISELENKAIRSLVGAKELILKKIPEEDIIAIYVKGSFLHRELRKDSDVDIVVVLTDEEHLSDLYDLNDKGESFDTPVYNHNDKNSTLFEIPVQFVAYTLKELQTGNFIQTRIKKPTPVSRFIKHVEDYKLIYGKELESGRFFTKSDCEHLLSSVDIFKNVFIPEYKKERFKFYNLLKQVFWLTDDELRFKKLNPIYSWEELDNSIENKKHIIYKALKLRNQITYSQEEEKEFILQLEIYLEELSKDLAK